MAGLFDTVYQYSPIWLQQVAVAAYGYTWYKRRFGAEFHRHVDDIQRRDAFDSQEFMCYQETRLQKILEAAKRSVYYQRVFHQSGVTSRMAPFETLQRLPHLSKEVLRSIPRDLLTERRVPRGTQVFRSSGTTGTPTEVYYTKDFHGLTLAIAEARNLNWAGATYRDRRVMFGVRKVCRFNQKRPPFWRYSPAEDLAYCSIYHLSREFLPAYLRFLRYYKPRVVMGYPSALRTIADFAIETGDLPAAAKVIVTTSETVTDETRAVMEAAWRCRVFDRYGAVEGCVFASQCESGRYHVSPDIGIIEIVDEQNKPCGPGQLGRVVATGLYNCLQPLIRYELGDVACWAREQKCPCGRAMPIIERIEGRFEDMCVTPDGRCMLRFDTVFKGISAIREAQVVQEAANVFVINIVPAGGFDENSQDRLKQNMRLHAGNVKVEIRLLGAIPRTQSGKFRGVVCRLPPSVKQRLQAGGITSGDEAELNNPRNLPRR